MQVWISFEIIVTIVIYLCILKTNKNVWIDSEPLKSEVIKTCVIVKALNQYFNLWIQYRIFSNAELTLYFGVFLFDETNPDYQVKPSHSNFFLN